MNIETQLSLQQNVKVAENKVIASPIEAMKPPLPSSRPPVPVFTNTSHNIKQIQNDQPNLIKRKPVITNAEERRDMLSTDITSSDGLSEESTRPQGRQHAERDVIIVKSDFAQERPTTRNNTENTEKNRESKKNIDRSGKDINVRSLSVVDKVVSISKGNDTQVIEVSEGSQSSDDVSTDWPEGSSILDEDELIESNSNRFSSKNTSPLLSLGHKVHSTHTILEEEEYTSESSEEVEVHEKEQQPRKPSAFESENSTTNREQQPRKPSAFESENSTTNRERQKIQEHNNFNKPRDNLLIEESKISALQKEENSFDVSELSSSQELESSSTSLSSLKLKNQMQQIASVVQNAKPIDLSDDESNFSDLDDIEDFSFSRPAQVHSAGLYGKHANVPQNGAAVSVNPTRGIPNRQLEEDDEFDFDLDD
ncbi:hypothetical protein BJ742DRAFT_536961 [Cladochytrium replicatum]|nr:hypothetical protein BJ742DRAFT_536961 [Cladochytrium replicatum]